MLSTQDHMGRLVAVYRISAPTLQRAFFVLTLAILFFIATAIAFLLAQRPLFLLLAFGFMVVSVVSSFSFVSLQRTAVNVYEGGLEFRKFIFSWDEIQSVEWKSTDRARRLEIKGSRGRAVVIPGSIGNIGSLEEMIVRHALPARQS